MPHRMFVLPQAEVVRFKRVELERVSPGNSADKCLPRERIWPL
jgi:hypothetical protein